jgi:hypothetical protein
MINVSIDLNQCQRSMVTEFNNKINETSAQGRRRRPTAAAAAVEDIASHKNLMHFHMNFRVFIIQASGDASVNVLNKVA